MSRYSLDVLQIPHGGNLVRYKVGARIYTFQNLLSPFQELVTAHPDLLPLLGGLLLVAVAAYKLFRLEDATHIALNTTGLATHTAPLSSQILPHKTWFPHKT